jgi:predicted phage tail component-like protein
MKGITFGNYHSYNAFQLILAAKTIGTPSPKTEVIDIPGGDGVLDLTEFFGETKYSNRKLSFEFSSVVIPDDFMSLFSMVQNALHGQKLPIILDDDPEWYYVGRISVSEWKADRNIGKLTIDCDCEPYKYQKSPTVVNRSISGTSTIYLENSRKRVVPEVKVTSSSGLTVTFGSGSVWTLASGSYLLPELELVEGDNPVTVSGTGSITFTYSQAAL